MCVSAEANSSFFLQAEYMNDLLARRNAQQPLSAGQVTLLEGLLTRFASFSTGLRMYALVSVGRNLLCRCRALLSIRFF